MDSFNASPHSPAVPILDVREVPCSEKHPRIIETWWNLPVGGAIIIRNRHAPERIREQIEAAWPGALGWEVLTVARDDVSVKITKLQPARGALKLAGMPCHSDEAGIR